MAVIAAIHWGPELQFHCNTCCKGLEHVVVNDKTSVIYSLGIRFNLLKMLTSCHAAIYWDLCIFLSFLC